MTASAWLMLDGHWWLGGLVPVAAAVLASKHATSKIAFVGAAVAFAAFQVWPAATRRLIAWAWAGALRVDGKRAAQG